jgi:serine protease AprX
VAGIVAASGAASNIRGSFKTLKGIAPKANIINLRVLDANGSAQDSDVIAAIGRAIELKNTYNIRVINLSLGRVVFESFTLDPLCQAVEAAWKAGIVVVTAAGNAGRDNTFGRGGYGTIIAPGNDPYVITVGAMNAHGTISTSDDTVATFSSKGPTAIDHIVKPDLMAPGNGVVSLLASPNCTLAVTHPATLIPVSTYATGVAGTSSSYFRLSGTSMAAPVVSGSAALLIQRNPSMTPDQIKAHLMKTAGKAIPHYQHAVARDGNTYDFRGDIFTVGAGYLNIFAALQNNDPIYYSALSPAVQRNPATGQVNLVRDLSIIWGDLISGNSLIWGDALIWGDSLIWGDTLALVTNGTSLIWGDSLVASTFIAANSIIWGDTLAASTPLQASSADDGDQN